MQEDRIPFGVVLIAIGFIVLLTITAVWLLRPDLMPRPIYQLASPYLAAPESNETAVLLPETPLTEQTADSQNEIIEPEGTAVSQPSDTQPILSDTPQLTIPRLGVAAPIQTVSLVPQRHNGQTYYQWQVPNNDSVGWHDRSAPLGQPGNTVLNGHHNVYGEVFRDLADLSEGDEIIVFDGEAERAYEVTEHLILAERGQPLETRLANANWINPTGDERLTLITCWPYTSNSHRVVVVAHPVATATDS
ncbi:MAG: sortase [Chloroflexota bacterium]